MDATNTFLSSKFVYTVLKSHKSDRAALSILCLFSAQSVKSNSYAKGSRSRYCCFHLELQQHCVKCEDHGFEIFLGLCERFGVKSVDKWVSFCKETFCKHISYIILCSIK